jgi:hypothetical protein
LEVRGLQSTLTDSQNDRLWNWARALSGWRGAIVALLKAWLATTKFTELFAKNGVAPTSDSEWQQRRSPRAPSR